VQVAARDRPDRQHRSDRPDDEDEKLEDRTAAQERDDARGDGGEGHRAEEEETGREHFAHREQQGHDRPDQPGRHAAILTRVNTDAEGRR
jgi:hypothetical protein